MTFSKVLFCLANSPKNSGRCIAGIEKTGDTAGSWIRPIGSRPGRGISEEEMRYENGEMVRVGHIVSIEMQKPQPDGCHVEDYLIDDNYYWRRVDTFGWALAQSLVEEDNPSLWRGTESSTYGNNDRICEVLAHSLRSSLKLVRPRDLVMVVQREQFGRAQKRAVRAAFSLSGLPYMLKVADPRAERSYLGHQDGRYPLDEALLCVGLSEPFHGYVYLLAATILTKTSLG